MLKKLENAISNEYKPIKLSVNDDQYFLMENGVVFELLYLPPFDCFTVSYADDIDAANKDFFQEGDQFDADQSFESLLSEIKAELSQEAA